SKPQGNSKMKASSFKPQPSGKLQNEKPHGAELVACGLWLPWCLVISYGCHTQIDGENRGAQAGFSALALSTLGKQIQLRRRGELLQFRAILVTARGLAHGAFGRELRLLQVPQKIGRASCRESVDQQEVR